MIANLPNKYNYLRIATAMLLALLIGCKILMPVIFSVKAATRIISLATEQNENDGEKKSGTNTSSEKEKEFASIYSHTISHIRWYTNIIHLTAYHNNYQSSYYLKISIPPPDLYLQPTV